MALEEEMMRASLNAIDKAMAKEPYSDDEVTECVGCHTRYPNEQIKYIGDYSLCKNKCFDDGDVLFWVASWLAHDLDEEHAELVELRKLHEVTRKAWGSILNAEVGFREWEEAKDQDPVSPASANEPAKSGHELMQEEIGRNYPEDQT